ncbi:MAG: lipoprotein-releasing system transmembrane subunit LolC [Rickettsiales bacterium]|nr:MAG: lipoprotein-releasing system transmembrane subunit LolC [Rickettsiales bacterium]
MLSNFISILSLRYFSAKKNEKFISIISAISLAGIAIGVAALIIVMSVMNGFHIELTGNIIGLNGDIKITPVGKTIENHQEIIKKLSAKSFVTKVTPVVQGQALVLGKTANSGVLIKGIDLVDLKDKGSILGNVHSGSFEDYYGDNAVAVGSGLAGTIGVYARSKIKMISPVILPTLFGSMPRAKDFKVVSVFSTDLYDYDSATMLMPISAAQKFLGLGEGINLLEINVDDSEKAKAYARELQKELGANIYVTSWLEEQKYFLDALEVERSVMFMILSLIMIVAAFNIISSLFMIVKDKTKDIAILRTIGASTKQIMCIFIINGMMTGFIGTALGVISGLLFSYNIENIRKLLESISGSRLFDPAIYFLYTLPSVVRFGDVVFVASLALGISFLATIYPAYKAAILNPVEAMRYE